MYRLFLILLTLGMALAMLTGCRPSTLSPIPISNTTQAGIQTPVSSSAVQQPEYGGTLKCVTNYSPAVLSYMPEMSVFDYWTIFPAVEKLMDASDDRSVGNGLEPVLAEQVEDDIANKRFVIHLRPGIHFSDGSVLNSDAVIWNYEKVLSWGGPQYRNSWKGIEKIDELTFEIDYTEYSNQLIQSWATIPIFSQAAWEKAAGGDEAKGKEWARANIVGTGPFVLKEFKRDDHLTWVKNLDYWQKGKPYLDEISVRIIPDPTTAQTLMLSGERNFWVGPPVKNQIDLEKQGLVNLKGWMGFPQSLFPNTADPKSRWNDLRLRSALEYALDKPAIAKALGQGFYKAMRTLAPEGEWGYDPAYHAREYDPVKARALLAEAGYSNGLDAKLLILGDPDSLDIGVALKPLSGRGWHPNRSGCCRPGTVLFHIVEQPGSLRRPDIFRVRNGCQLLDYVHGLFQF